MKQSAIRPLAAALTAAFLLPAPAPAQESFTIAWSSLDGGGGASAGPAEFTLGGSSVGQAAAGGGTGEPGEFSVAGGYWTFPYEPLPDLVMQLDSGTVTLTWSPAAVPVVLESSEDMELWAPVDPQPVTPFFQEPEFGRRYYRLSPP